MRKYIFESTAIFVGILLSFSVDRYNDERIEKENITQSVLTLVNEIESNIEYCEEHLKQLQNMVIVNKLITSDYNYLRKDSLINLHQKYPYGHSYDINGNILYWNEESNYNNIYQWMITWWNTFSPEEIYFKSLINSGKLVLINNTKVRKEIESVYTTRKERNFVNLKLLKQNSDKIFMWIDNKRNNQLDITSREFIFTNLIDLELKNLLNDRNYFLTLRVMSISKYIESLNNLKSVINLEYN
ncbi:MAG: hypothetical protein CMC21_06365 [Flavobacteriaceae bacterium]|nr:hypothetical protein [Flavobacteriaceae bacterium]|tara:strand:+ start:8507 stop:9235 length:729 start_codon:yes stop_codon:yes gene_type:complete